MPHSGGAQIELERRLPRTSGMNEKLRDLLPLLIAVALAACGQSPTAPAAPATAPQTEVRLSTLVNDHRASLGCPRLTAHGGVASVAQEHSDDMARRGFFDHVNPEGQSPFDRLRAAGISWNGGAAENIARARTSAEEVFRAWLASPGHRAAIEDCEFTHHGVGAAGGYWTQLFVTHPVD